MQWLHQLCEKHFILVVALTVAQPMQKTDTVEGLTRDNMCQEHLQVEGRGSAAEVSSCGLTAFPDGSCCHLLTTCLSQTAHHLLLSHALL
jgi:hypothetical protein